MFSVKVPKKAFFDSEAVLNAMDKTTRQALSKFGAFVWRRAKTSIRPRKGTSPPGSPPYGHVGTLRDLIFFAYDFAAKTVVIGPVVFDKAKRKIGPAFLEAGGSVEVKVKDGKAVLMRYRARPFMGPAFRAELPRAAKLFQK